MKISSWVEHGEENNKAITENEQRNSKYRKDTGKQDMKLHLPGSRSCGCHCTVQQDKANRQRDGEKRVEINTVDQQRRRGKPDLFLAAVTVQKKP